MRAMILAAGRGTRMGVLTEQRPKPLLEAAGKALIAWQIERLVDAGVRDIVINHAYLGQSIEQALGDGRRFRARLTYSSEVEALETLGGIVQALRLLGEQPFILVSGDLYTEYPYAQLIDVARSIGRDYPRHVAHLVLTPNPSYHPHGDMGLEDGVIVLQEPRLTYGNIGVFHPRLFDGLARGEKVKLFPWIYRFLGHRRITGELYTGPWHNVGTPADLARLNQWLAAARTAAIAAPAAAEATQPTLPALPSEIK